MDTNDLNEAFSGINKVFNTEFKDDNKLTEKELKQQIEKLEKDIDELNKTKKALTTVDQSVYSLEDQEYLRDEIKTTIISTKNVMKKLESDIKIGSHPRIHEVYAKMVTSVTDAIKELRELNKTIIEMKHKANVINNTGNNNTIKMKPEQLMKMIDLARENNSMNKVDAEFTINEKEDLA